jgi:hypothetical protein
MTDQITHRIKELETLIADEPDETYKGSEVSVADLPALLRRYYEEELEMLTAFVDEWADEIPDWKHGCEMIADYYFVEYAQQLAEDMGAIDREAAWPACHIDWEAAADSLRMDYFSVEFGNTTYWVR